MAGLDYAQHQDLIHSEVDRQARRLRHRHGLPADDVDDVRQDLITDLLSRAHAFDERRAGASTFVGMVVANRAALFGRQRYRDCRLCGPHPISLDEPIVDDEGGMTSRGDLVADADGYAAWMGQETDAFGRTERCLDLISAAGDLSEDLRNLCAALSTETAAGVCRSRRKSRADLYRRVRDVRLRFRMAGLTGAA